MVKSGITRRIDELGRIVIPKEIRKNLKIRSSDELDITIDGDNIILNKHTLDNNDLVIDQLLCCMGKYLNRNILLTSKDQIIYYFLLNKEKINSLSLDNNIINIIEERKCISSNDMRVKVFSNYSYIINPIIINGDLFGSIILYGEKELNSCDKEIICFCQMFFENYLE